MSIIVDKITGFKIGDPEVKPFITSEGTTLNDVQESLKPMILSASGWRKIFAKNGDEESTTEEISQADKVISCAMAKVFADFVKEKTGKEYPEIVLAQDSRHTGSAIADAMIRTFITEGLTVQYLFISAAPEAFCYTKANELADGFAYISASHNPIGHNGVKFGLSTGGVIDGSMATPLIEQFKLALSTKEAISALIKGANNANIESVKKIYTDSPQYIEAAK
ncbi:MAG: hypothetical protein B6229_08965, partial [Spirochaetaceae bacterium 4572_7]